jgi:hypothetical protein
VSLPTSTELVTGDRRACPRYRYESEVRFEQRSRDGSRRIGHGTTADLSRRCVRFRAEEKLEPGTELVLRMAWPEMLQNVCALEMLVSGVVTRVTERGAILSIGSYELRTCGPRSFCEAPELSSSWQVA